MPFFFEILINVNLRGVIMSEKSEDLNSSSFRCCCCRRILGTCNSRALTSFWALFTGHLL